MTWTDGRLAAFDLETTAADPDRARIVTAAIACVGGGGPPDVMDWLADPGVEIPPGATEVHGISTEFAQEHGRPPAEVIAEIIDALFDALTSGSPLVIFNARYDLTVLDREARRHGLRTLTERLAGAGIPLLVIDPLVIDKQLERYRSGLRTLEVMAGHYNAVLDGAHDATFDAFAVARVAWRIGKIGRVVRKTRNADEEREFAELHAEWESVRGDLVLLTEAQARWAIAERNRFAEYKREQGAEKEALRIEGEVGWPVIEPPARENVLAQIAALEEELEDRRALLATIP